MKILVTGGAGFIASHIVDAYLAEGHEVHIVDDMSSGKEENLNPKAVFHQMDIADPAIISLLEQERFEALNHHAAQMDVRKSVADPIFDARVNITGSLHLIEHGVRNGLKHVVFASSGGTVYGEQEYFPADEKHIIRPISPYGITKAALETYLYFYHLQYGLRYVALRYGNVFGPRQNPHGEAGVIAIFAKRMLAGQPAFVNGDGLQTRDYVFIEDVVSANVMALNDSGSGSYNIGTGVETNVVQLFDMINAYYETGYERMHRDAMPGEQRRCVLSHDLITSKMGWKPAYDLAAGMAKTLDWFRERYQNG